MAKGERLRLIGKLFTPTIVPTPFFHMKGCRVNITKHPIENDRGYFLFPVKRACGKLTKGERRAPRLTNCYSGYIVIDC